VPLLEFGVLIFQSVWQYLQSSFFQTLPVDNVVLFRFHNAVVPIPRKLGTGRVDAQSLPILVEFVLHGILEPLAFIEQAHLNGPSVGHFAYNVPVFDFAVSLFLFEDLTNLVVGSHA